MLVVGDFRIGTVKSGKGILEFLRHRFVETIQHSRAIEGNFGNVPVDVQFDEFVFHYLSPSKLKFVAMFAIADTAL
jgi:hypothetical protein